MSEQWKDIEGYKGLYSVSNWGRVKSLGRKRNVGNGGFRQWTVQILKPYVSDKGYSVVGLYDEHGVMKTKTIHRLVASAFLQKKDGYNEVNHIDGDKGNNDLSNLEWCTRSENLKHAYAIGLASNVGELHPGSKFLDAEIYLMKKQYATGVYMQTELARVWGVSKHVVNKILKGKNYSHVVL